MTDSILPAEPKTVRSEKIRTIDRTARKILLRLLEHLSRGKLTLIDGDHAQSFGSRSAEFLLEAVVTVHHPRFYRSTVFGGTVGSAEAYINGYWTADDLTALIRILTLNQDVFNQMEKGLARMVAPMRMLFHFLNKNTRRGSRENILVHYDLGDDFYKLFLDETLTYSCGIFETEDSSLKDASDAKYDRICQKLRLGGGDHVLEIGTGWGGFAIHAARHYDCRVTTTTISDNQHQLAAQRFADAGLTDKITLLKQDYRDLSGRFDKLVSIEMIEAVGHHFLDTFFRVCSERLKPDGIFLLQAITIRDQVFEKHKRSVDFIKRFIFPGSCIPSITAISRSIARATDLKLFHLEDITPHYARTLREWRRRFFDNIDAVRDLGFSEAFIRMWEYYLCYCEGGFAERYIGDVQMLFTKPLSRPAPLLGQLA
jgi:cyclopropane-fatty-acyl-phospholipid synthase